MEINIDNNEVVCDYEGNTYRGFTTNLDNYDINKNKWINALDMMKDCKQVSGASKLTGSEANEAIELAGLLPDEKLVASQSEISISPLNLQRINIVFMEYI